MDEPNKWTATAIPLPTLKNQGEKTKESKTPLKSIEKRTQVEIENYQLETPIIIHITQDFDPGHPVNPQELFTENRYMEFTKNRMGNHVTIKVTIEDKEKANLIAGTKVETPSTSINNLFQKLIIIQMRDQERMNKNNPQERDGWDDVTLYGLEEYLDGTKRGITLNIPEDLGKSPILIPKKI